jgi:hypothetical protein
MKIVFKGISGVFLAFVFIGVCAAATTAHFVVTVTDGEGNPVKNAQVQGYFTNARYDYKPQPERLGVTDENGKTDISGPAIATVYVKVDKDGYYESEKRISVERNSSQSISFLLRPKKNPIAMYAKHMVVEVNKGVTAYGLNFFDGSLVLPNGMGADSDVYIAMQVSVESKDPANLELSQKLKFTFPNKNDGIAVAGMSEKWWDSKYKSAYQAPENGYADVFELYHARGKGKDNQDKNIEKPLYLRIRTITNKKGKIVSAIYCKIFPGIRLIGALSDTPGFIMTYYCNPTPNDRNVEFDPSRNLFKNLKPDNRVLAP